jgi:membrane associated rhomboid family serine protease
MTEFRPGRFQILPVVIKNLLIINGLVFLAQLTIDGMAASGDFSPKEGPIMDLFALHHILSPLFKPWQLITHVFMHGGLMHIFGNMFALWMFGSVLENLWGPKRFLVFYIMCGLGAAVLHLASLYYESMPLLADIARFKAQPSPETFRLFFEKNQVNSQAAVDYLNKILFEWSSNGTNPAIRSQAVNAVTDFAHQKLSEPTVGASGAVFGCLAAFGYLFPNTYIYLYFFVPIKAKWFVLGYIALELYFTWQTSAGDNVAHFSHLGGALVGFLLDLFWNRTNRRQFY